MSPSPKAARASLRRERSYPAEAPSASGIGIARQGAVPWVPSFRTLFAAGQECQARRLFDADYFDDHLTNAYILCILICMRTTLNIDDEKLSRAAELTGVKEKTSLVRMGLDALIASQSAVRLAALGGTEKKLRPIRRRRSRPHDPR